MTCCIDLFYNCWASLFLALLNACSSSNTLNVHEKKELLEAGQCAMTLKNNNHAGVKPNEVFVLLCS